MSNVTYYNPFFPPKFEDVIKQLSESGELTALTLEHLTNAQRDATARLEQLGQWLVNQWQEQATLMQSQMEATRNLDALLQAPVQTILDLSAPALQSHKNLFRSPFLYYNATQHTYWKVREPVYLHCRVSCPPGIETTVTPITRQSTGPVLFVGFSVRGITQCAGLVSMTFDLNSQPATGQFSDLAPDPILVVQDLVTYDFLARNAPRFLEGDIIFGPTVATNTDIIPHAFIIILTFLRLEAVDREDVPNYWRT